MPGRPWVSLAAHEMAEDKSDAVRLPAKPWYRSTKKCTGVVFLLNGLGMAWFSFFRASPNDLVAIIGMLLGTGITLLGIKTAGGLAAARHMPG